jgi:hypothetical protein
MLTKIVNQISNPFPAKGITGRLSGLIHGHAIFTIRQDSAVHV